MINRERTSNINFEDIVDAFASLSDRRMGSYSTSTIVCLSYIFDSGFIVKHFAPSQMSLAPASPIAHFGLAAPLVPPLPFNNFNQFTNRLIISQTFQK